MQKSKFSWISPLLEVRTSQTNNEGTFAKDFIKKDTVVMVQGGRILSGEELDSEEFESVWYHAFQVELHLYIAPISMDPNDSDAIFKVNHSCDPNIGIFGNVISIAMRNIKAGEELMSDYAMWLSDDEYRLECKCGKAGCRRIITGNDWKMPRLQEKYRDYFSTYIQKKINKRK